MSKISRNSPCPCGSGKKYKKCCLSLDRESVIKAEPDSQQKYSFRDIEEFNSDIDTLIDLSNSVVDLVNEGELDKAESVCHELINSYPDQIDGIERLAMVYEARGDKNKAREYYKKTAEFAQSEGGFDPEFVKWAFEKADELSE